MCGLGTAQLDNIVQKTFFGSEKPETGFQFWVSCNVTAFDMHIASAALTLLPSNSTINSMPLH